MGNEYREQAPPTWDMVEELKKELAEAKAKEPLKLRYRHTFLAGVVIVMAAIYTMGATYDSMHDCGKRLSIMIALGVVCLLGVILSVCSMAAAECDDHSRLMSGTWADS